MRLEIISLKSGFPFVPGSLEQSSTVFVTFLSLEVENLFEEILKVFTKKKEMIQV